MITEQELFYELAKTKKVILFGASGAAKKLIEWGKLKDIQISYFCDNNENKWNSEFLSIQVFSPLQLSKEDKNNCIILITSSYVTEITKLLKGYGFNNICSHYILLHNTKMLNEIQDITYENLDKFAEIRNILSDAASKEILKQLVIKRLSKCLYYDDIREFGQYFRQEIFNFNKDEIYIDAGAFDGDTIEEFIQLTNGKYQKIYAFEPDKFNFAILNKKFKNGANVELLPYGLWSSNSTLSFSASGDIVSQISNKGNIKIKTIKLDDVVSEEVSFIKMDIEGAELEAILGAEKIITKYKPKLAICLYYKQEDLYLIPLKIKELVPEYRMFIRHHGGDMYETVLYATL